MSREPLSKPQAEIMQKFYNYPATSVVFDKSERNELWKQARSRSRYIDFTSLDKTCPALAHRIRISYETGNNIQSAVFSECVYAQTLANMMGLNNFDICNGIIPPVIKRLLQKACLNLEPRYLYYNDEKTIILIQAGGCNGIDSVLFDLNNSSVYTIEFKEPGAKTSEPDLPKYGEDGKLLVTKEWLKNNPQFSKMLEEQEGLNFFNVMGNNIHNFSKESIEFSVANNYSDTRKQADVICTEDKDGFLVMLPSNQVSDWADIEGEIRPSGRNKYKVWTPIALRKFLLDKKAEIYNNTVKIKRCVLGERKERGSDRVSGYKINPLFFVYVENCNSDGNGNITFDFNAIRQLNPTIAAKVFFKKLRYNEVKKHFNFS